jgi:hypothetical protein
MATRAVGRAAIRTVLTKAAPTLSSHIEVFIVCIVFLRRFVLDDYRPVDLLSRKIIPDFPEVRNGAAPFLMINR